jgi:hypothetical protein
MLRAFVNVNALNAGEAEVLKSCGLLIYKLFAVPEITIPLLLAKETIPLFGIAVPVVPKKVFELVFAKLILL